MKVRRGERIIDTETIEIKADLPKTIERLMQMNGVCRESDSTERPLEFYCDKKGKIFVSALRWISRSWRRPLPSSC